MQPSLVEAITRWQIDLLIEFSKPAFLMLAAVVDEAVGRDQFALGGLFIIWQVVQRLQYLYLFANSCQPQILEGADASGMFEAQSHHEPDG